jgi:hypothetical protein
LKERGKTVHTGAMLFYGGVDEKIFGDMLCDERAHHVEMPDGGACDNPV